MQICNIHLALARDNNYIIIVHNKTTKHRHKKNQRDEWWCRIFESRRKENRRLVGWKRSAIRENAKSICSDDDEKRVSRQDDHPVRIVQYVYTRTTLCSRSVALIFPRVYIAVDIGGAAVAAYIDSPRFRRNARGVRARAPEQLFATLSPRRRRRRLRVEGMVRERDLAIG